MKSNVAIFALLVERSFLHSKILFSMYAYVMKISTRDFEPARAKMPRARPNEKRFSGYPDKQGGGQY